MRQALTFLFSSLLMIGLSLQGFSQERYIDEVFTDNDIMVTDSVIYGVNFSILPAFLGIVQDTIPVALYMDVYAPMNDTTTDRPVIVYGIGGTFFPAIVNGGFTGERADVANVDFAMRMAKRGYVVAVVQYRRGWNPLGSALVQQRTILHAAYRGIQDMRNAVRFFRFTEAEQGDLFGIDPNRIAVGGNGTGGYMSYGATYLKRFDQTLKEKFIDFTTTPATPFLDEDIFGDPYGIDSAAINRPNYPTYSSDFNMGFALGGALGDRSWVEQGDAPFVALHCERDPGAPYEVGDVIAVDGTTNPPSPFAVIPEGAGGLEVTKRADSLGNQDVFKGINWGDTLFTIAAAKSGDIPGLYPFDTPFTPGDAMCLGTAVPGDTLTEWGGPWNYFNEAVAAATWDFVFMDRINSNPPTQVDGATAVCVNKRGNPNDLAVATAYMDTITRFLAPHLAIALQLPTSTSVNDFVVDENVEVFPNPANNFLTIQYRDGIKNIEAVKLLDLNGRTVRNYTDLKTTEFELQRNDLTPGLYILQVSLPDGVVNKKVLFN